MDEIKKLLNSEKLIMGKDETLKAIRSGSLRNYSWHQMQTRNF
jgi:ribosomal protein L30E